MVLLHYPPVACNGFIDDVKYQVMQNELGKIR
jgi:hypothetical protein